MVLKNSLFTQKTQVKANVMPNDRIVANKAQQIRQGGLYGRRALNIGWGNTRQLLNFVGDGTSRIDEGIIRLVNATSFEANGANFNDRIPVRIQPGCFYIEGNVYSSQNLYFLDW